jgi:hypothetical protein
MALQQRQLLLLYVVVFMYSTCFMAQVSVYCKYVCVKGAAKHKD